MIYSKSYTQLQQESLTNLKSTTNITQTSPGSKARALLDIFNSRLSGTYQYFTNQIANLWISQAAGDYLDLLGDFFACPRRQASYASVTVGNENAYFYVASGTFGDLNNGNNITVPAGTIISSIPLLSDPTSAISFKTTSDIILLANANKQYIPLEAVNPGTNNTVLSDTLVIHNLTSYPNLLVNNADSISNTNDQESDEAYRYRLINQVVAAEAANETALRMACLSVPGVADVQFNAYASGTGTIDVYVLPITGTPSASLLSAVQAAINQNIAAGCRGLARAPEYIGLQFQAYVYLNTFISNVEIDIIRQQLIINAVNYFNSFSIGQKFYINNFLAYLLSTDARIKTIGQANKPFSQMYIWKPSYNTAGRRRYILSRDYDTAFNERFQLENQSSLTAADFIILSA